MPANPFIAAYISLMRETDKDEQTDKIIQEML